jgi:hypothetical protein
VRRLCLRVFAAAAAAVVALAAPPAPAQAAPVLVYPGMEIHQDNNVCTLGFVEPSLRIAFTAGHCRGSGPVTDKNGNFIGSLATFRDNTPDGATVATDQLIADYEAIGLATDVVANNLLPGGRPLESDPTVVARNGEPVCHFGVSTGESCGTVQQVNNGWFTMAHGIISQKGDSGGPVYVLADNGRAVIVGVFNSTWGEYPAAVSWQATALQVHEDVTAATSMHTPDVPSPPPTPGA